MYTILFNKDKQLIQTGPIPLYVGERGMTEFRFLVPQMIEETDVTGFACLVRYQLPDGGLYRWELKRDAEPYKGFMSFRLSIDEKFTASSGYVYYNVALVKVYEDDEEGVFKSKFYESEADFIEIRNSADFKPPIENEPEEDGGNSPIYWYKDMSEFPASGKEQTIYIATNEDRIYRWDKDLGQYAVIGSDWQDITLIVDD